MCSKNVDFLKYYDHILAVESHRSRHFCLLFGGWKDMYLGYKDREATLYFCQGPQCWCERYLLESVYWVEFLYSWAVEHYHFLLYKILYLYCDSIIRLASCMLASGCDDGSFTIRDLRLIKVPLSWQITILYACIFHSIHLNGVFPLICVLVITWAWLLFARLCIQYSERKNISETAFWRK
jgi:hypothetical protein